jgi:hypothetical protein
MNTLTRTHPMAARNVVATLILPASLLFVAMRLPIGTSITTSNLAALIAAGAAG